VIQITGSTQPSSAKDAYQEFYPRYRELYPALADQFAQLAKISSKSHLVSEAN
jgi:hypothetical protein